MDAAGRISASHLRVEFHGRRGRTVKAVDDLSLEVRAGETFCIAGESGCGKTTLGRTLLGLVPRDAGDLEVNGSDPSKLRGRALRDFRRRVQVVFQDPMGSLNPRQTVYEVVAEGIRIHGLPGDETAQVAQALSKVGLRPPERFFLAYPHELSGGQRQRVVIASALALGPKVLIADEPVSMLDASVRGEILRLLVDLKTALGMTLVLITHDLGVAWALADRVAIMYLGRIVEVGTAEQVLMEPAHPYTRALLEVAPEVGVRRSLPVLTGEPPDPAHVPPGCRFHPRCPLFQGGLDPVTSRLCTSEDPPLLLAPGGQSAACHATTRAPRRSLEN
jgi:peptide/nickel transport system ATP-binding protein